MRDRVPWESWAETTTMQGVEEADVAEDGDTAAEAEESTKEEDEVVQIAIVISLGS